MRTTTKRKPSANGVEVEGSDDSDDDDSDSQDSGTEPQEPIESNTEDNAVHGPDTDSSVPDSPKTDPVEAKKVYALLDHMRYYYEDREAEEKSEPKISTVGFQEDDPRITAQITTGLRKGLILLDGGASHNVYYSPTIPEGSFEKKVELAHGTQSGYVKGGDITFLDEKISKEDAKIPTVRPNNSKIPIPVINNCPYANQKVLRVVKK